MSDAEPIECRCICHYPPPGGFAMHFTRCCEGICPTCLKFWEKGKAEHIKTCRGPNEPLEAKEPKE